MQIMFRKKGSRAWNSGGYVGNVERYISAIVDGLDKPEPEIEELRQDIREAYISALRSFYLEDTEFKFIGE